MAKMIRVESCEIEDSGYPCPSCMRHYNLGDDVVSCMRSGVFFKHKEFTEKTTFHIHPDCKLPDAPAEVATGRKSGNRRLVFRRETNSIWEVDAQGNYLHETGMNCRDEANLI